MNKDLPQNFEEKREKGENDDHICQLIRDDSINEFISFINKTNFSLETTIQQSIFETNNFLIKSQNKISLIEYSAFHGSIQIFKYLILNKVKTNPSIWFYAIHSNNQEIIHFLKEKNIRFEFSIDCYKEAIKCFHNDIANYIMNNFYMHKKLKVTPSFLLKSYNFNFMTDQIVNKSSFYDFCKYDYYPFVEFFVENDSIDYNKIYIY